MPCDATTRPGELAAIFVARIVRAGGSQPSQLGAALNRYVRTVQDDEETGLRIDEMRSSVGFAKAVTSTASPPMSRASAAKSGVVATTLSFFATDRATARNGN
jgi:hypothetical protein